MNFKFKVVKKGNMDVLNRFYKFYVCLMKYFVI
jgi:hypothetical protein